MSKTFGYHEDRDRDRYIGDSEQLWYNADRGYHIDSDLRVFSIKGINARYAANMRGWYLRINMQREERKRLMNTKLFYFLNDITKTRTLSDMIELGPEIRLATVQEIGYGDYYSVILEDAGDIGDTIVSEHSDGKVGQLHVGVIDSIQRTTERYSSYEKLIDVITDSCDAFKMIKNKVRIDEIKREIEERMTTIDERHELEMYAKVDDGIKDLLDELDIMREGDPQTEEE